MTPLVHTGVVERTLSISPQESCSCEIDSARTESRTYTLVPAAGGGWPAWTAAFTRLLIRLVAEPTHCILVMQEPNQRYVQLMIGHGHAHVEAASNTYLLGDFRLGPSDERMLESLGFQHPDRLDPEHSLPHNWWFDEDHADPRRIAVVLTAAMIDVMAFDARWPVTIEVFGAAAPCASCFWEES